MFPLVNILTEGTNDNNSFFPLNIHGDSLRGNSIISFLFTFLYILNSLQTLLGKNHNETTSMPQVTDLGRFHTVEQYPSHKHCYHITGDAG